MTTLPGQLREWRSAKTLIGFCRWADGDGMLWGRIERLSNHTVWMREVAPDGKLDETVEAYRLSRITLWQEEASYASRLGRLCALPPFPKLKREKKPPIQELLSIAAETQEPIDNRFGRTGSYRTVIVTSLTETQCALTQFDDEMRPTETHWCARSAIKSVRWRTPRLRREQCLIHSHIVRQRPLEEKLQEWMTTSQLVGLSLRAAGQSEIWGRVVALDAESVTVATVDPDGQPGRTRTIPRAEVKNWEEDAAYAERLELLADFVPTQTFEPTRAEGPDDCLALLARAAHSSEFVSLRVVGEEYPHVGHVVSLDGNWACRLEQDGIGRDSQRWWIRSDLMRTAEKGTRALASGRYLRELACADRNPPER